MSEKLFRLFHISDLHIHKNPADNSAVEKSIKLIAEKYQNHKIIITGDITDDGSALQMEEAKRILKPIADRIYLCAGNHDYGYLGLCYQEVALNRFLSMTRDLGVCLYACKGIAFKIDVDANLMLISADSNRQSDKYFGLNDFACGEFGASQLACLSNLLAMPQYRGYNKILFFHHHPIYHTDPTMRLLDADKLIDVIRQKVEVILFGHKHEMASWKYEISGVRAFAAPALCESPLAWEITTDGHKIAINEREIY